MITRYQRERLFIQKESKFLRSPPRWEVALYFVLLWLIILGLARADEPIMLNTKSHQVVSPLTIDFSSATVLGLPTPPPSLTLSPGTLAGRGSASGSGVAQGITLGTNLSMSGTTLNATGGTPGGSNTQVQFNDGGVFGGDAGLTWDKTAKNEAITGTVNAAVGLTVTNNSSGNAALSQVVAANNVGNRTLLFSLGNGYSNSGIFQASNGYLYSDTTLNLASGSPYILFEPAAVQAFAMVNSGTPIFIGNNNTLMGWGASYTLDTALARNAAGVVEINNGTAGQYRDLKARNLTLTGTCTGCGGGSGTPGGSNTQVQFNNSGAFGGDAGMTWDNTNKILALSGSGVTRQTLNAAGGSNANWTIYTHGATNLWLMGSDAANNGAHNFVLYDYFNTNIKLFFDGNGNYAALNVAEPFGWASTLGTGLTTLTLDTALYRNAAGVVEINNGTAGQYGQLQASGVNVSPVAGKTGNVISSQRIVTATLDQTAIAETAHVVYTVPANVCTVGTTFRITAWGDMDAGTTAITFIPKLRWGGTAGIQLLATPTVTSTTTSLTTKTWQAVALVTIRTTGATGTAMAEMELSNHISQSTGAFVQDEANSGGTAVTIDTTVSKDLDLTWTLSATTGTPHVRTYGGIVEIVRN